MYIYILWTLCFCQVLSINAQFTYPVTCHSILVNDTFVCNTTKGPEDMLILITCDGVSDCNDPDDEDPAFCADLDCGDSYVRCEGGECIREALLCDGINNCIPPFLGALAWDENLDQCPNPCVLEKPCKNGGECIFIPANFSYVCDCPDTFYGQDCQFEEEEEEGGLDGGVVYGTLGVVGALAAASSGAAVYQCIKQAKEKAANTRVGQGLRQAKDLKRSIMGKGKNDPEELDELLEELIKRDKTGKLGNLVETTGETTGKLSKLAETTAAKNAYSLNQLKRFF